MRSIFIYNLFLIILLNNKIDDKPSKICKSCKYSVLACGKGVMKMKKIGKTKVLEKTEENIGLKVLITAQKAMCKSEHRYSKEIVKLKNQISIIEAKLQPVIEKRKGLDKSIKLLNVEL